MHKAQQKNTSSPLPKVIRNYVKYVDYVSLKFGRLAMYLIFMMMGVLLLGAITRNILNFPLSWTVEMAQFTLAAYYIVGGGYSMQLGDHVRMDLIYDRCSERTKARIDTFTSFFLVFYLVCLLVGSISSTMYAIEYGQRKFSQWNPSMVPIKLIMVFGIVLILLQAISIFFKDYAKARGKPLDGQTPDSDKHTAAA
ncbi:MAG: TRAP transporter small permease subunit [Arenicellales bacterium WSBS_2016_MAG_OTU3]